MSLIKIILKYLIVLVLLPVPIALGQNELSCARIGRLVSVNIGDARIHRSESNADGCTVEFAHPGLTIDLETHGTRRAARKAFDQTARLFRTVRVDGPLDTFKKLDTNGYWDKALIIIPSTGENSYVMVLLRKEHVITSLSVRRETLTSVEQILRSATPIALR